MLTHWGRVTHICVGKLISIGADNGLSPGRRQAIIWTNAGLLLIGPLRTNFSEILIKFLTFSFRKMRFKVSSAKTVAILSWPQYVKSLNGGYEAYPVFVAIFSNYIFTYKWLNLTWFVMRLHRSHYPIICEFQFWNPLTPVGPTYSQAFAF